MPPFGGRRRGGIGVAMRPSPIEMVNEILCPSDFAINGAWMNGAFTCAPISSGPAPKRSSRRHAALAGFALAVLRGAVLEKSDSGIEARSERPSSGEGASIAAFPKYVRPSAPRPASRTILWHGPWTSISPEACHEPTMKGARAVWQFFVADHHVSKFNASFEARRAALSGDRNRGYALSAARPAVA